MPKRHAILHRMLKAMDKEEPAFIEPPFTVDYVRTLDAVAQRLDKHSKHL